MPKLSRAFTKVAQVALQAAEGVLLAGSMALQVKESVDAYIEDAGYRHGIATRRAIEKFKKKFGS